MQFHVPVLNNEKRIIISLSPQYLRDTSQCYKNKKYTKQYNIEKFPYQIYKYFLVITQQTNENTPVTNKKIIS